MFCYGNWTIRVSGPVLPLKLCNIGKVRRKVTQIVVMIVRGVIMAIASMKDLVLAMFQIVDNALQYLKKRLMTATKGNGTAGYH